MPPEQDWIDLDLPGPRYSQGRSASEVEALIAACQAAVAAHPDEKRFAFRLGLALSDAPGRTADALAAFETARRLGSVGGWAEAALTLLRGNAADPAWTQTDPARGLALLDEGIAKTGAEVLSQSRASMLTAGPEAIRDRATGLKELAHLGEAGNVHALIELAEQKTNDEPSAEQREEAIALLRKAVELGSGNATWRLALHLSDPAEKHRLHQLGAARGDSLALNNLGFDHHYGRGVAIDGVKARPSYEKAASLGNIAAQVNLGTLHAYGAGSLRDYAKAHYWFELAVARGSGKAANGLGMLYDHGHGVPLDRTRSRELFERAAALGSSAGMSNLGYLYEHGRGGTPVDLKLAREWFEKAVAAGNGDAMTNLAEWYKTGKGGLPRDLKKAFELLTQAARERSAEGTNNLANAYLMGEGVDRDPAKARELFRRADELGSRTAAHNLAGMFEGGQGGPIDRNTARRYFRKAAETGHPNAMYRYAMRVARDVDKSDEEAKAKARIEQRLWLTRAVKAGDPYGVETLAEMLADGVGGDPDPAEALRLYRIAAEESDSTKHDLAMRLRHGRGVPVDKAEARRLFGEADDLASVSYLVEMMDAGEGGPKDPKGATELLRERIAFGAFSLAHQLAERLREGRGTRRDPKAARAVLTLAYGDQMIPNGKYLLGQMRERGEGGPVDMAGAVAAYREADHLPARWRLVQILRRGARGVPADPVEARRLLSDRLVAFVPDASIAQVEMLDRGEGGPTEPEQAAHALLTAIVTGNARARDLALRAGGSLSVATRRAFLTQLEILGLPPPQRAETSGPLLTPAMLRALGPPRPSRRR